MNYTERERTILSQVNRLPKKILLIYGYENIPEFILYDLCHERCFNLRKAAYFVDNPDFNYCKGIAGFSRDECCVQHDDIWQEPDSFSSHMKKCDFHQKVRLFERVSVGNSLEKMMTHMADELGFEKAECIVWNMKHDNRGILVYERDPQDALLDLQDYLDHSVYLFGFCPIY